MNKPEFDAIKNKHGLGRLKLHSSNRVIGNFISNNRQTHYEIPDFQREYVWTDIQASRFIESLLLELPIGTIVLTANSDDYYEETGCSHIVIDGSQRLRSLWRFVNNEFALQGCNILSELNGLKWNDFDKHMKFVFETIGISVTTFSSMDREILDHNLILNIFKNINTGGTQITNTQMDNAIEKLS